jgi:hypothetical protein
MDWGTENRIKFNPWSTGDYLHQGILIRLSFVYEKTTCVHFGWNSGSKRPKRP